MGQVYRAVDTRLDRVVALKVLSSALSRNPQLRERFDREARAISSFSHPNVCTLYDVGHHDGIDYIVMEYVEGENLADRLTRGPLPTEQLLRYGMQLAEALAKAHRNGVVHRDLKPANVILAKSGAKLLDFGLAKTIEPAVMTIAHDAPTEQRKPLTEEGTILGTFHYMAPEQLEGREADARTDIFTFGVVLYEMATGRRPFDGASKATLIASILEREPLPVTTLRSDIPPALDRLIRACMAKDPDERLQSAQDAALQLRWMAEQPSDVRAQRKLSTTILVALAVCLALAAAAALFFAKRPTSRLRAMNLSILPPPGFQIRSGEISQNGSIVIGGHNGKEHFLFVRTLADPHPRQLIQSWYYGHPFWSPDGKWIGFFDRNKLMKVAAAGGAPETICESSYGMGGSWSEDGTIIFTPGYFMPLHVVKATGGTSRPLTRLDRSRGEVVHAWPKILPDRNGVLYLAVGSPLESSRIMHVTLDGRETRELLTADAIVGYTAPFLLFVREASIYAVRFDPAERKIIGEPKRVADDAAYSANQNSADASVTPDGILLYPRRVDEKRRLVWYDREGRRHAVVLEDTNISDPRLSPDGKRILFSKSIPEKGTQGVYSFDIERGLKTLLTGAPAYGWEPIWLSRDEFAFSSARRSGTIDVYAQLEDAQAEPRPLWVSETGDNREAIGVTPDGKNVLIREYTPERLYDIWLVPVSGKGARTLLVGGPGSENSADVSPDGRWLTYSGFSGLDVSDIYVRAMSGGRAIRVSGSGGYSPRWSRDGKEIFYITPDNQLMQASVSTDAGETAAVAVPKALFRLSAGSEADLDLSPDGTKFLVNEPADPTTALTTYNVLTGWKEALERP